VALCLVDLAKGYERKTTSLQKPVNEAFVIECAKLALAHHLQNINAKLLWAETLHKRLVRLMQAHGLTAIETVGTLPAAKATLLQMEKLYGEMEKAGYREMPKAMYLHWLATVKNGGKEPEELKNKPLFDTQDGNPFRDAGYYVPVLTLSNGRYQEFQRDDTLLRMGSVMYNRFTHKVAYLLEKQTRTSEASLEPEVTSRFFTVDRFADKYDGLSPYQYGANNPVINIDVNGDSIWVAVGNQKYYYGNTKELGYGFYDKSGNLYNGNDKFVSQVNGALARLSLGKEGESLVSELASSKNNFTIQITTGDNKFDPSDGTKAYANQLATDANLLPTFQSFVKNGTNMGGGSGGVVHWNPNQGNVWVQGGKKEFNPTSNLAHELFHGRDSNRGLLDNRTDYLMLKRDEWQAVFKENQVRSEQGWLLRTDYRTNRDANGVESPGGPAMLNKGRAIRPAWVPTNW